MKVADRYFQDEIHLDIPDFIENGFMQVNRRALRRDGHKTSRERNRQDYCGATFHVSQRNQGRKPRSKGHRS